MRGSYDVPDQCCINIKSVHHLLSATTAAGDHPKRLSSGQHSQARDLVGSCSAVQDSAPYFTSDAF